MSQAAFEELVASLIRSAPSRAVLLNYIVPGLKSTLLATLPAGGVLRVFEMTREQESEIVPHNHRYDFQCYVLEGFVQHTVYHISDDEPKHRATHAIVPYSRLTHELDRDVATHVRARAETKMYEAGSTYGLNSAEFHRVRFSYGAKVLFHEGNSLTETSSVLVPYCNGEICDSYVWRDWMMKAADPA